MKFAFLDDYRGSLSRAHACRVMGVTDRGLRAWKHRPVSHRQRRDMVLLAHIRNQHRMSQGSYGRPRMTEELNELGLHVGHRRVGRLMRQNAICVVRTHKFKATTDSDHTFNIAPNLLLHRVNLVGYGASIWMGMRRLVIAVGRGKGFLLAKEEAQCPVAM